MFEVSRRRSNDRTPKEQCFYTPLGEEIIVLGHSQGRRGGGDPRIPRVPLKGVGCGPRVFRNPMSGETEDKR